jgi:hypothetical protein
VFSSSLFEAEIEGVRMCNGRAGENEKPWGNEKNFVAGRRVIEKRNFVRRFLGFALSSL